MIFLTCRPDCTPHLGLCSGSPVPGPQPGLCLPRLASDCGRIKGGSRPLAPPRAALILTGWPHRCPACGRWLRWGGGAQPSRKHILRRVTFVGPCSPTESGWNPLVNLSVCAHVWNSDLHFGVQPTGPSGDLEQ